MMEYSNAPQGTAAAGHEEPVSNARYTQEEDIGEERGLDNFEIPTGEFETCHLIDGKRVAEVESTSEEMYYIWVQTTSVMVTHGDQAVLPEHENRVFFAGAGDVCHGRA